MLALHQISAKDSVWAEHKYKSSLLAERFSNLKDPECKYNFDKKSKYYKYNSIGHKMNQCCNNLKFRLTVDGDLRLAHVDPKDRFWNWMCKQQKLCCTCQWRRSRRLKFESSQILERMKTEGYGNHRWLHVTLTLRNIPIQDLKSTIKEMETAWRRLTKERKNSRQSDLRKKFPGLGWFKSLEVTREAKNDYAHPHFHCLIMVEPQYFNSNKYLDQKEPKLEWSHLWQKALQVDYLPSVHVNAADIDRKTGRRQDPGKKIPEICKYTVKESDLVNAPITWLMEYYNQMHRTRCFETGGIVREFAGANFGEDDNIDLVGELDDGVKFSNELFIFNWETKPIPHYALDT